MKSTFKQYRETSKGEAVMTGRRGIGFIAIVKASLVFGIALVLVGCSSDLGLNPATESAPEQSSVPIHLAGRQVVPAEALTFIDLPEPSPGMKFTLAKKGRYDEELIEPDKGGELEVEYEYSRLDDEGKEKDVKIKSKLKVYKNSITEEMTFGLGIDLQEINTDVDLIFGPHGTIFQIPADLSYDVDGLDLVGLFPGIDKYYENTLEDEDGEVFVVNPDDVGFYYYHEDIGMWEKLDAEIKINVKKGDVSIKAKVPHFSRYALAISR